MNQVTEAQANFIRSLAAQIEARVVVAPKKVDRWFNPVKAHENHLKQVRQIIAELDAGTLTKAAASTHIPSLKMWTGK